MREEKIITPTIRTLMDRRAKEREDLFLLVPLALLESAAPLGGHATLLYAILYSVHRMQPRARHFLLQAEFEAAVGRGYRWWHRHTAALEQAGLIEVKRSDGAKPRYRLLGLAAKTAARTRSGTSE